MQTCPKNWDDHLRELSYRARVVEKWNPFAKIRQDLFGIIDIVALKDGAALLSFRQSGRG